MTFTYRTPIFFESSDGCSYGKNTGSCIGALWSSDFLAGIFFDVISPGSQEHLSLGARCFNMFLEFSRNCTLFRKNRWFSRIFAISHKSMDTHCRSTVDIEDIKDMIEDIKDIEDIGDIKDPKS